MPNSGSIFPPPPPAPEPAERRPERRLTRRRSIAGALVEARPVAGGDPLVVFGVDLNADGMGVTGDGLPPPGSSLELTFQLSPTFRLRGVPSIVIWVAGDRAGVRFSGWSDDDRLHLVEYLGARSEAEPSPPEGGR